MVSKKQLQKSCAVYTEPEIKQTGKIFKADKLFKKFVFRMRPSSCTHISLHGIIQVQAGMPHFHCINWTLLAAASYNSESDLQKRYQNNFYEGIAPAIVVRQILG